MRNILISAACLAGAAALAGARTQEGHDADHAQQADCCSSTQSSTSQLSATPFLEARPGPAALGRVVFIGPRPADAGGKAAFKGDKPEVKPMDIDPEKATGCVPEGSVVDPTDRSLLISEEGGIANVVITVEVDGAELQVPEAPFEMDQTKCRFEPHVVVIPAGATVEFVNSDQTSHNVHTYPKKNDAMNKTIAVGSKETQKFDKTDEIEVKCDIHPWMKSYLVVTDTPFYAVTGADGSFSIAGLPEGKHKVEYWHEKLGKGRAELTVNADGSAEPLEIELSEDSGGGGRRRRR
jgi:plastocyanin